jgi:DNA repair ATPase RecN
MNETQHSQTIFARLGNWFRRGGRPGNGDLPLTGEPPTTTALEPRSTFLRPWGAQRATLQRVQESFDTLTELMSSIREHMDRQSHRQDELATYLSHLPEVLRAIPETSRIHGETLRAIHQQVERQNLNQEKLADILEKLSNGSGEQRESIDEIRERVDAIRETDEAISSSLSNLGVALRSVSENSTTGAQVLEQMRDRIDSRDGQLEQILRRQGTRFTTMLAIAIFLSISALAAVCVIGYVMIIRP